MQYLVSRIYLQVPDALDLTGDMPSLAEAKLVVFGRLTVDLRKIEDGIEVMKSFPIDGESELAAERLRSHLTETQRAFARASARLNEAISDFRDLAEYVGESATIQPEELFGELQTFIRNIEAAAANIVAKTKRPKVDLFKRMSVIT